MAAEDMTVAVLTAAEVRPYRALMLEAYARAADAFTSTPEERAAEPEEWWIKRLADRKGMSLAFGAFREQVLVGTATLEFSERTKTRHKAHLIGMYVSPAARGTGAGKALLEAALAYLDKRPGISAVMLTVTQGNEPALGLYRSAGFVEFGTEPMAVMVEGGYKAKVHMWRPVGRGGAAA